MPLSCPLTATFYVRFLAAIGLLDDVFGSLGGTAGATGCIRDSRVAARDKLVDGWIMFCVLLA